MKKFCLFVFGLIFLTSQAIAQNKVVVIPLLDEKIKENYAPVEKTGQSTSYATGDDGDLQKGVAWPNPRFTDNFDGTVTDNLTGLIWLKNANCFGMRPWEEQVPGEGDALSDCNGLTAGYCGLTAGSSAGNWRLPNIRELLSLIDYGQYSTALPAGHPFINVQHLPYWTSTYWADANHAWVVDIASGTNSRLQTWDNVNAWCVRGGQ